MDGNRNPSNQSVYRISSFKTPLRLFNFGTLGAAFNRERGVYKRAAFISKTKVEENEIMHQFKTIRYFLHHAVLTNKLKI